MNETLIYILAFAAGALLGVIFFGGLWWTVQKGLTSKIPAVWFLGSLLIRMAVTLSGFYFIADGHWQRLGFCLLGFIAARFAITWLTQPPAPPAEGHPHAP